VLLRGTASTVALEREKTHMIDFDDAAGLPGKTLAGSDGEMLGTIDAVYADGPGGALTFATVHGGAFGAKTTFVPLTDAALVGDAVTVPYSIDLVETAPTIDTGGDLEPGEEQRLYQHYGVTEGGSGAGTGGRTLGSPQQRRAPELHGQQITDGGGSIVRGWDDGELP